MLGIGVAELAVVMVFGIPMLAILGWILLSALKILRGESTKEGRRMHTDEARIMQEIHLGLSSLEKRVESLETLLLDRARVEKERWGKD
jgi:predicted RND superfamily exporter protein